MIEHLLRFLIVDRQDWVWLDFHLDLFVCLVDKMAYGTCVLELRIVRRLEPFPSWFALLCSYWSLYISTQLRLFPRAQFQFSSDLYLICCGIVQLPLYEEVYSALCPLLLFSYDCKTHSHQDAPLICDHQGLNWHQNLSRNTCIDTNNYLLLVNYSVLHDLDSK